MSHLTEIEVRHIRDRWRDAVFIAAAALLTALSIGAVTSKAVGKPVRHEWTVTVVESAVEVSR